MDLIFMEIERSKVGPFSKIRRQVGSEKFPIQITREYFKHFFRLDVTGTNILKKSKQINKRKHDK